MIIFPLCVEVSQIALFALTSVGRVILGVVFSVTSQAYFRFRQLEGVRPCSPSADPSLLLHSQRYCSLRYPRRLPNQHPPNQNRNKGNPKRNALTTVPMATAKEKRLSAPRAARPRHKELPPIAATEVTVLARAAAGRALIMGVWLNGFDAPYTCRGRCRP